MRLRSALDGNKFAGGVSLAVSLLMVANSISMAACPPVERVPNYFGSPPNTFGDQVAVRDRAALVLDSTTDRLLAFQDHISGWQQYAWTFLSTSGMTPPYTMATSEVFHNFGLETNPFVDVLIGSPSSGFATGNVQTLMAPASDQVDNLQLPMNTHSALVPGMPVR
jgi:hypothetical protein